MAIISTSGRQAVRWAATPAVALLLGVQIAWSGPGVEVHFSLRRPTVSLGEPVYVDFSVSNGLAQPVRFDLGADRKERFKFTILRADGSRVDVPQFRRGGFTLKGDISLAPGGMYSQALVLSEWYRFPRPGNYQLNATVDGCVQPETGLPVECNHSQTLPIQIEPRDPRRLAEVCESLAKTALESADADPAREAALGLSYVEDLVAVPYLAEISRKRAFLSNTAITGLGRIANVKGLGPVMSLVGVQDRNLERLVESALREIHTGATVAD